MIKVNGMRGMGRLCPACLLVSVIALCNVAVATNYYWVGASNDWWNAASYSLTKGGAGGTVMPGADDRVIISKEEKVYVDDDTIAFFSTVKEVQTWGADIMAYFNITTNADLGCYFGSLSISGNAGSFLIKDGAGVLKFAKPGRDDLYRTPAKLDTFHYTIGLDVRGGGIALEPCIGSTLRHRYRDVIVNEGCTIYGVEGGLSWFESLSGAGTVTNRVEAGSQLYVVASRDEPTVFSGFISGFSTFVPQGHTYYTGTHNNMGTNFRPAGYTGDGKVGITGFMTFAGPSSEPSSLGRGSVDARYTACLLYLGTTGETIERGLSVWRTENAPFTWDAGAYGGLRFTGNFYTAGGDGNQQRLVLTGSNTVTCVVSNKVGRSHVTNAGSSFHITKKGTGTWRFDEHASNDSQLSGVIGVEDGVLECASLRDSGFKSALGYATELYADECKCATNGLTHVDYAHFLGGEGTTGTLRYLSDISRTISTRPLALKGNGRIEAPNCAALNWKGVTSLGEGEKSLTVVCAAGQTNTFANITNGAGVVSVAKEGAGDLVLSGELSFGGDLFASGGGTLTVKDINGVRYDYYKLTFQETVTTYTNEEYSAYEFSTADNADGRNTRTVCLDEFGLYSAVGSRVNFYEDTAISPNTACQMPGTVALEYPELLRTNNHTRTENGVTSVFPLHVGRIVDNNHATGLRFCGIWNDDIMKAIKPDDPLSWISVVVRLKTNSATPTLYDLHYTNGSHFRKSPTAFTISGSADGLNYEEIASTNNITFTYPTTNYVWLSNDTVSPGTKRPETVSHPGFPLAHNAVQTTYNVLNNVRSIGASAGTTLKFEGTTAPVVSGLKVDAVGSGTIDGFSFAADGTLSLTGVDADATAIDIPADFRNAAGLANVANWTTLTVNGAETVKYSVASVSASAIRVVKHGFKMVIR